MQYTQLHMVNAYTKSSEFPWMTDSYVWQDDAACAFSPPTMFEVAFQGDPIAEGLSVNEIKDLNSANIEAAKKVCNSCPVWHLCYQVAEVEDFWETVRAGVTPLRHNSRPAGRPKKPTVSLKKVTPKPPKPPAYRINIEEPCKRGHLDWKARSDKPSQYYCNECKRVRDATYRAKKAKANPKVDSGLCKRGHFEWGERSDGKGRRCLACRREGERRRDNRKARVPNDPSKPCQKGHFEWTFHMSKGSLRAVCLGCRREKRAKVGA